MKMIRLICLGSGLLLLYFLIDFAMEKLIFWEPTKGLQQ